MALDPKLSVTAMSTSLLISLVALPLTVIAFVVLYRNHDSLGAEIWLWAMLPTVWLVAAVLTIRDVVKRRGPWRQIAGIIALLVPTVVLFNVVNTYGFWGHELFSRHSSTTDMPTDRGIVFAEQFRSVL